MHPTSTTVERLQIKQPRPKVRCSLRVNQAEKKSAKILTKQLKLNIFAVNRENRLRLGITLKLFAWRFCSRLALSLEKNKKIDSHDCPFQKSLESACIKTNFPFTNTISYCPGYMFNCIILNNFDRGGYKYK